MENKAQVDFMQMLVEMRRGGVAIECTKKMSELVTAVLEHPKNKGGEFVMKLTVKPSKFIGTRVAEVSIDCDVKIKKPEEDIGTSLFFVSKDNKLQKDDPRQAGMFAEDYDEERAN